MSEKEKIIKYYENLYSRITKRNNIYQTFFNANYKTMSKMFDELEQMKFDDIKIYLNNSIKESKDWIIFIKDIKSSDEASFPFLVSFSKMGFNIAVIENLENEFDEFLIDTSEFLEQKLDQIVRANRLIDTISMKEEGIKGIVGVGTGAFTANWFVLNQTHLIEKNNIKFNINLSMVVDPLNFVKQIKDSYSNKKISRNKFKKQLEILGIENYDYLINNNNPLFNKMIPSFYIHAIDDQVASVLALSEFLIKKYKKYNSSQDWKLIYNYGEHNNISIQHFNDIAGNIFDFFVEKKIFDKNTYVNKNLSKEFIFDSEVEEKIELLVYLDKGE